MAILNATPDSFYQNEKLSEAGSSAQAAVDLAGEFLTQGASLIDIGGMSTKPGAKKISPAEESDRVLPVISAISKAFPDTVLSIDTVHASVFKEAAEAGAQILNDVSAGQFDSDLIPLCGKLQMPYVLMHMQGRPETMQDNPRYDNLLTEVFDFFTDKLHKCREAGIRDVILDPGLGFGKTIEDNYRLLGNLNAFNTLDCPLLIGASRKSMIWKVLNSSPSESLNGTTAVNTIALLQGASILRVHDPAEAREVCQVVETYLDAVNQGS